MSLKQCFFVLLCVLFPWQVHAQDREAVSTRIVENWSAATWKSTEASMPTLLAGIEVQLRNGGATESAARALTDAIKAALTRDAFTQALAVALEKQMTPDELIQLEQFFQSPIGKKYLSYVASVSEKPVYLVPVLRKACDSAKSQLGLYEKGSIHGFCSKIDAM